MKNLWLTLMTLTMTITLVSTGNLNAALVVEDFEGIPDTYLFRSGNQSLDGYLPGLFFGPHVTILDRVRLGFSDLDHPPHSGDAVLYAYPHDYIRVDFVGLPSIDYVEAWYASSLHAFYMEAYDADDNLLDSASGPANKGSNSLISVSGANIAYVKLHDSGNYFIVDDFAYAPEPATIALLGLGSLVLIRRKRTA